MYISLWENSRGHPDNVSFMQFSTKIDGFEQKDSQGFENSYNSYEQYPLEKFFIFTIYQNYTLALNPLNVFGLHGTLHCNCKLWEVCSCYQGLTESKAMTSDALRNGLAASPNHTLEAKISVPFPFWPWCLFGCPVHRKKSGCCMVALFEWHWMPQGGQSVLPFS